MRKLLEYVYRWLHIPIDWEKYDYVVNYQDGYAIYSHAECGYSEEYIGKDKVAEYTVVIGTRYQDKYQYPIHSSLQDLPLGYRVRNSVKEKVAKKLQTPKEFRILPVKPITKPCQGESAASLGSRRYQKIIALGGELVRIDDDGYEFYKVPSACIKGFNTIARMFS